MYPDKGKWESGRFCGCGGAGNCGRFAVGPMGKKHVERLNVAKEGAVICG